MIYINEQLNKHDEVGTDLIEPITVSGVEKISPEITSQDTKSGGEEQAEDFFTRRINKAEKRISDLENKFENSRKESIAIIGIFSAVVAFLMINAQILKELTLMKAVIFLTGIACIIIIFVSLMVYLLDIGKISKRLIWLIAVPLFWLIALIIIVASFDL